MLINAETGTTPLQNLTFVDFDHLLVLVDGNGGPVTLTETVEIPRHKKVSLIGLPMIDGETVNGTMPTTLLSQNPTIQVSQDYCDQMPAFRCLSRSSCNFYHLNMVTSSNTTCSLPDYFIHTIHRAKSNSYDVKFDGANITYTNTGDLTYTNHHNCTYQDTRVQACFTKCAKTLCGMQPEYCSPKNTTCPSIETINSHQTLDTCSYPATPAYITTAASGVTAAAAVGGITSTIVIGIGKYINMTFAPTIISTETAASIPMVATSVAIPTSLLGLTALYGIVDFGLYHLNYKKYTLTHQLLKCFKKKQIL